MKPTTTDFTRLAWSAALGGLLPVLACAQTTSPPGREADDTILLSPFSVDASADDGYYATNSVSGTRTRTELINLPLSMQVFTDQFIRDIGATNLIDVVKYASGVTVGTGQATNDGDNTSFTLRGQVSFVPMRNGFRRLRLVDAANIERVEILKGPASLLYGQLNPGGNVNYITKRPLPSREFASFTAQVGSYEFYRGVADLNQVLVPDKLAMRLVSSYEDSESIIARYHNITQVVNPSATWWIRPETTLTVEFERSTRKINAPKSGLPFHARQYFLDADYPIDRSWNTHTSADYHDTTMTAMTGEFIHRFAPWLLLRANVTKNIWSEEVKRNGSNVNIQSDASGNPTHILNTRTIGYGKRGSWDQWKQFEFVNNFSWGGIDVQNIVGYQHEALEFRQNLATTQTAPSTGVQWNLRDPSTWILTNLTEEDTARASTTGLFSTNVTKSYYFANQLSFLEGKVRTLAGVRYDKFRVFSYNPGTGIRAESEAEPAKIPQVGVLYKPWNGVSVYATYSESFLPVFNTGRRADGTFFSPGPQSGKGYDLGIKWERADSKIAGSAAIYHVENTDIVRFLPQVTIPGPNGPETFAPMEQSGTDASEGFELDLRARPLARTQLMLSYAYTDAWVKSDTSANTRVVLPSGEVYYTRTGHWLSNSPKHTFSGWIRHDLGGVGRLSSSWVMGGWIYVTERAFTEAYNIIGGVPTPPPNMEGYATFDLGVGGRVSLFEHDFDVTLQGKNIFDKLYMENRFHFGAPRTVMLSISTRF
jgi:iron complex outermembrane recepter protein